MNLRITTFEKRRFVKFMEVVYFRRFTASIIICFLLFSAPVPAQDIPRAAKKPVLIRDTDIAEGKEPAPDPPKEPDPARSKENLNIGNMYLKRRNYSAAISRYIEAIAWLENSIPAHEALARAYEKNGDFTRAIQTLEAVIEKNPDSAKNKGFQAKIAGLRKKLR